ncbi:glutaredoxin family protein [Brachybacterium tyrofermentans]|uniref:glutaredoxin family protein n=1 Tax=Brachybacterium tyrofermentans TaxID=47848 RepID=UPI003FB97099
MDPILTIYGRKDCRLRCPAVVRRAIRKGVPYKYVDLDEHPEDAQQLRKRLNGEAELPICTYGDDLWTGVNFDKIDAISTADSRLKTAS